MVMLDTHIWNWFHLSPARIRDARVQQLMELPEFTISSLTLYEAMTAIEKGKLGTSLSSTDLTDRWLQSVTTRVLPLTADIARLARTLPFEHADPFDRFIAATAFHENCPLVTADANLLGLPWLKTLPA